jgi:hypothetical protein
MTKKWLGKVDKCDLCDEKITTGFVDGRLIGRTSWALICFPCFRQYGAGLGTGLGQKYVDVSGEWIKSQG